MRGVSITKGRLLQMQFDCFKNIISHSILPVLLGFLHYFILFKTIACELDLTFNKPVI